MENSSVILLVVAIAGGLFLLWIILYLIPVGLWFQALVSDVKISLLQLVLMRWRKVPPTVIVSAMIEGKKAGIELYRDLLEAHYLAGRPCGPGGACFGICFESQYRSDFSDCNCCGSGR